MCFLWCKEKAIRRSFDVTSCLFLSQFFCSLSVSSASFSGISDIRFDVLMRSHTKHIYTYAHIPTLAAFESRETHESKTSISKNYVSSDDYARQSRTEMFLDIIFHRNTSLWVPIDIYKCVCVLLREYTNIQNLPKKSSDRLTHTCIGPKSNQKSNSMQCTVFFVLFVSNSYFFPLPTHCHNK